MPIYEVELKWTTYKTVEVEAENEEQAWEKSEDLVYMYGEVEPAEVEGISLSAW